MANAFTGTAATATSDLTRFRRMVAEDDDTNGYTDTILNAAIARYPLEDSEGVTDPDADDWDPTYDLNAAAGDIWEEKASSKACNYAINSDGASLSRNQVYEQAMKQARRFRSRRVAQFRPVIREGDATDTLESQA